MPTIRDCTFCRIVAGELEAHVVLETEHAVAFLDHRPLFPGHVLVSPREHVETLPELPIELVEPLFAAAKLLSTAVPRALDAQGSFVSINNTVSQSVPHLHVHVVPRTKGDGLRGFFWPRHPYDDEAHEVRVAESLRKAIEELRG